MEGVNNYEKYLDKNVRNYWLNADYLKDKKISITIDSRIETGIAYGVDYSGALLVNQNQHIKKFTSGHIELIT
jgi:biotin-(acetyl-CoA carboxylase) ligase